VRIATWNVNSIKARLQHVLRWLDSFSPDVALLQEIKITAEDFPREPIAERGYRIAAVGQKAYNGVALLAKQPIEDIVDRLPGDADDSQARYVEATVGPFRIASIYLPNGNPVDSDKFPYKLAWMQRLIAHARTLLATEMPVVLGGDYNICPTDADVFDPFLMADDALCQPRSRACFRQLLHLGYTETWRSLHSEAGVYTFWDYQAGRWQKDQGLRIDHILLSPQAADRLVGCEIDRKPRAEPQASDHTPVWVDLMDAAP
jgi:exodeoxyribonuclease-3